MVNFFHLLSILILGVVLCDAEIENNGQTNEYKLVETSSGVIRGTVNETLFKQKRYFAFRGIPYAQAPIGSLRFKVG